MHIWNYPLCILGETKTMFLQINTINKEIRHVSIFGICEQHHRLENT